MGVLIGAAIPGGFWLIVRRRKPDTASSRSDDRSDYPAPRNDPMKHSAAAVIGRAGAQTARTAERERERARIFGETVPRSHQDSPAIVQESPLGDRPVVLEDRGGAVLVRVLAGSELPVGRRNEVIVGYAMTALTPTGYASFKRDVLIPVEIAERGIESLLPGQTVLLRI